MIQDLINKAKELLNKLGIPYATDPKNNAKSVSLTLLMITFIAVLVGHGLLMAEKVKSLGSLMELFYATSALYFGRRYGSDKGKIELAETVDEDPEK